MRLLPFFSAYSLFWTEKQGREKEGVYSSLQQKV